ncbi:hypothetical protein COS70_01510, partial [Candidatus Micrarchaeota archaeon CG06_land_8_20_14_3_00_50_6]
PKILDALAGGNVTAELAQERLSFAVANNATAADVPKILDVLAGGNVTDELAQERLSFAVEQSATAADVPKILDAMASCQVTNTSARFHLSEVVERLIDPENPEYQTAFRNALPALKEMSAIRERVARLEERMQSTTAPSRQFTNGSAQPVATRTNGTTGAPRRQITN